MSKKLVYLAELIIFPVVCHADTLTLGTVSAGMLEPITIANQLLSSCCILIGIALIVGSALRYTEHRRNPVQVRLTTPIFFLILGILLAGLPLIARYSPATTAVKQHQAHLKKPNDRALKPTDHLQDDAVDLLQD